MSVVGDVGLCAEGSAMLLARSVAAKKETVGAPDGLEIGRKADEIPMSRNRRAQEQEYRRRKQECRCFCILLLLLYS